MCRVSGPVVIGENMRGCAMYELVRVGHDELVGGMYSQLEPGAAGNSITSYSGLRTVVKHRVADPQR